MHLKPFCKYKAIFWDFDGTIVNSVNAKLDAFLHLFATANRDALEKITRHHLCHGGVSRFEKIPLYLSFCGITPNSDIVNRYLSVFSELVVSNVLRSPLIPGAAEYLRANYQKQSFSLITATPQREIEDILTSMTLHHCFQNICGAPLCKTTILSELIQVSPFSTDDMLYVGDSLLDYKAALSNKIDFLCVQCDNLRDIQPWTLEYPDLCVIPSLLSIS
jgi:phosphoglycolate phosphatase-like HAD superfamily hydrolase